MAPPDPVTLLAVGIGGTLFLALAFFAVVSSREREGRAARRALLLSVTLPVFYLAAGLVTWALQPLLAGVLVGGTLLALIWLVLPRRRPEIGFERPSRRVDERDIMFARWRLVPGSPAYHDYYARRPAKKAVDDRIRRAPGLFAPGSQVYHPQAIPAAEASFAVIDTMRGDVDGPVSDQRVPVDASQISTAIKALALHYGARAAGITER